MRKWFLSNFTALCIGLSVLAFPLHTLTAQSQLWGMTSGGGQFNAGSIFNTDGSGNNEIVQFSWYQNQGSKPLFSNIMQASDGMLYGMTYKGGANDSGMIFQYNPATSSFVKKFDFDGINGSKPFNSLIQTSTGMLCGMTYKGGVYGKGVLFQYNPATSVFTKLLDFDGATTGCYPHGSLIECSDGSLYGLTVEGGLNNFGTLFQYNPSTSVFTKKLDFDGTALGANPLGSLMQATDGMIYGTTHQGGTNGVGVLFQYNPVTSVYTKKIDLDVLQGILPLGKLLQANNGILYGLTCNGGINNMGTLFQYDLATSSYTKKIDFDSLNTGNYPHGFLIQASDNKLYGLTTLGGLFNNGTLFQYDLATSTLSKKVDFNDTLSGSSPFGSLMQAANGKLYGMTNSGGLNHLGVFFEYALSDSTYQKLFDFGSNNGSKPHGSLVQTNNGNLYGLTNYGGKNNQGVLFTYNPSTFQYTKYVDFNWASSGANPEGSIIQAGDGNLYGMTKQGGANDVGVIFQFNPISAAFIKKTDFDGAMLGATPFGSLTQANDNMLYGMTSQGGANNFGVLFQYNPQTSLCIKKIDFDSSNTGSYPHGSLVQAIDGMLYGMTTSGGSHNMGTIFQYNSLTSGFIKKIDFDSVSGGHPLGSLIQLADGMLYGMTNDGGIYDKGVLFQYDPVNGVYTKKIDFDGVSYGSYPIGDLVLSDDGNIYGMTHSGGINNNGVLFQYNPMTSAFLKKTDYNSLNGSKPYGTLIEILPGGQSQGIVNKAELINSIAVSPNPSTGIFTIKSKEECELSVITISGQTIESIKLNALNNYTLDIRNLSNGMYYLVGNCKNGLVKQKIIVLK